MTVETQEEYDARFDRLALAYKNPKLPRCCVLCARFLSMHQLAPAGDDRLMCPIRPQPGFTGGHTWWVARDPPKRELGNP